MDLNLLPTFAAVAETSSFSKAAQKLRLPKSSVSRNVAALEQQLGVRLVHRTTRRVALSTAGAALYERVAPLLAELQNSLGGLPEREAQPAGQVRLTASFDLGATVLPELLTRFAARYPLVSLDVRLSNVLLDLVGEGIDVALRFSSGERLKDSSLRAQKLRPVELQLFASPEYLARRGAPGSPAALEGHAFVVLRGRERLKLQSAGENVAVTLKGRLVADEMTFLRKAVRAGAGIGCLPSYLGLEDVRAGAMLRVLPRWTVDSGFLWFVTPPGTLPRKVSVFRDFLREELGAL